MWDLDDRAGQDYDRLCAVVGRRNLFDFPAKAAYHEPGVRIMRAVVIGMFR
ncbi:MAG: hypothetical protein JSR62_13765 [Nitrospira sp.]|nr:hypothetical protein [Nitrospira sp.]